MGLSVKGLSLGNILKFWGLAETVIQTVEVLIPGRGKGVDKKAAAVEALAAGVALYEEIINKDQINDPVVLALLADLIEVVLKAKKDAAEIEFKLRAAIEVAKAAKGTGAPLNP